MGETGRGTNAQSEWRRCLVIQRAEDIAPAFEGLKNRADALYVAVDQLMVANRTSILMSALAARLPTIFSTRDFVKDGALMSTDQATLERFQACAPAYVDKITAWCRSPAISQSSSQPNSELVINPTTAEVLSVSMCR